MIVLTVILGLVVGVLNAIFIVYAYRRGLIDGQRLKENKPLKELTVRNAKGKVNEPMREEEYLKFINEYGAEGKK